MQGLAICQTSTSRVVLVVTELQQQSPGHATQQNSSFSSQQHQFNKHH